MRATYALAQIDRSHGGGRLQLKDDERAVVVDEEWLYLTSDAMATLIEDVDVFIYPKARRKAHVEKITSLSALGQP